MIGKKAACKRWGPWALSAACRSPAETRFRHPITSSRHTQAPPTRRPHGYWAGAHAENAKNASKPVACPRWGLPMGSRARTEARRELRQATCQPSHMESGLGCGQYHRASPPTTNSATPTGHRLGRTKRPGAARYHRGQRYRPGEKRQSAAAHMCCVAH